MIEISLIQIDGILNLICAVSMVLSLWFHSRGRSASFGENRLRLLLLVVLLITGVRAYSYLVPSSKDISELLMYFASVFSFAVILFAEGITRRHAPLLIKLSGVIGTVASLTCLILLGASSAVSMWALIGSQVVAVASFIYIMLTRKHSDLSPQEEQLIQLLFVAATLSIPLIVTDFRDLFNWNFPRLGALAPMLVLAAIQASLRHESVIIFATRLFVHGLLVMAVSFFFFPSQGLILSSFVLALILLGRIIERLLLKDPYGINYDFWQAFNNWSKSKQSDLRSLRQSLESKKILLWGPLDLEGYNQELLGAYLSKVQRITLSEARMGCKNAEERDISEQIIDLLESNNVNLLLCIEQKPFVVLMANIPLTLGTKPLELEMIALQALTASKGRLT